MSKAKIENWSVISFGVADKNQPNEAIASILMGIVSGHGKIEDGKEIVTSPIRMISYRNRIAATRNTEYELGEPNKEFLVWLDDHGFSIENYEAGMLN